MLVHLRVQNIALIDEVAIDLGEGLNVLSGETGAGKSILLGAINLALGARGSKSLLRDAARPAAVELLFVDEKPAAQEMLAEWGIEAAGGEIIIARRFTPSGRSICQINQQLVTTAQVKKLAAQLIDIHGQHEHQSLLDSSRHIDLLDRFIPEVDPLAKRLTHAWEEHRKLQDEWERYEQNGRDRERLLSLMQYELTEIEEAAWQEGEEEALQEERKKLLYSEKLSESCLGAYTDLHGQQLRERSVIDSLEDALQKIQDAARYDDAFFSPYVSTLQEQAEVLRDVAASLRGYAEALEADPERLTAVQERLDVIAHLKSKYGQTWQQVRAYYEKTKAERDKLEHISETMQALEAEMARQKQSMQVLADQMTKLRLDAAKKIEKDITAVLETLQFDQPIFKITRTEKPLSPKGCDQIVFQIRTNVGEAMRPLHQIASGGEMSRVMLSIKTVLARQDEIGTLIFDEIDTGISGRTAQSVAEKMSLIAQFHQVICVSHLPQIAAMADTHLRIEKTVVQDHTITQIQLLTEKEQEEELARMLGGASITPAVLQNAKEMKALAKDWKASHISGQA